MAQISPQSRDPMIQSYLKLSTPNVSDALDRLQIQGASQGILPLWPGCRKLAGRAVTIKLIPMEHGDGSPVLGTLEAIISGNPGDVLVIDQGGRTDVNSFGGIAAFTAAHQGLVGAVIDGVTRDVDEMRALGFSVYAKGVIQQSIRHRCAFAGHGIEVDLGRVAVHPEDLVIADDNGVVIVPGARANEVLSIAQEFAETEERIKDAIGQGMNPVEAHERVAYDRMT